MSSTLKPGLVRLSVVASLFLGTLLWTSPAAWAHGGGGSGPSCAILEKSGYAVHLDIYVQASPGSAALSYCQDVPATGQLVLAFDLITDDLKKVPIAIEVKDSSGNVVLREPARKYPAGVIALPGQFSKGRYVATLTVIGAKDPKTGGPLRFDFVVNAGSTGLLVAVVPWIGLGVAALGALWVGWRVARRRSEPELEQSPEKP
ncbi:hypothetical protein [Candidatus Methylacidithermus pantelleriae]|uniref:Uncharacterized protein n=1 Tax=Candidatus Methylacidithermus pantelleriae TaxID=2744239 RepID=A0A8J2BR18_9BACT|nr:hypothetical protein [Candidatus Methylacidithermus pantelleriae]CAF0689813.1 exported hypothetical protein [Candidatus Methylacidithermus pantelleriae]CAF0689821.1 exported hypothetical protein [Candidatus Methylacidithermus pantelleriae]